MPRSSFSSSRLFGRLGAGLARVLARLVPHLPGQAEDWQAPAQWRTVLIGLLLRAHPDEQTCLRLARKGRNKRFLMAMGRWAEGVERADVEDLVDRDARYAYALAHNPAVPEETLPLLLGPLLTLALEREHHEAGFEGIRRIESRGTRLAPEALGLLERHHAELLGSVSAASQDADLHHVLDWTVDLLRLRSLTTAALHRLHRRVPAEFRIGGYLVSHPEADRALQRRVALERTQDPEAEERLWAHEELRSDPLVLQGLLLHGSQKSRVRAMEATAPARRLALWRALAHRHPAVALDLLEADTVEELRALEAAELRPLLLADDWHIRARALAWTARLGPRPQGGPE